jgi:hypothetical protein
MHPRHRTSLGWDDVFYPGFLSKSASFRSGTDDVLQGIGFSCRAGLAGKRMRLLRPRGAAEETRRSYGHEELPKSLTSRFNPPDPEPARPPARMPPAGPCRHRDVANAHVVTDRADPAVEAVPDCTRVEVGEDAVEGIVPGHTVGQCQSQRAQRLELPGVKGGDGFPGRGPARHGAQGHGHDALQQVEVSERRVSRVEEAGEVTGGIQWPGNLRLAWRHCSCGRTARSALPYRHASASPRVNVNPGGAMNQETRRARVSRKARRNRIERADPARRYSKWK